MREINVVGQAGTTPNYNNMIHVCSVLKYLRFLGVSVAFDPADAPAASWASNYFAITSVGEEPVPVIPGSAAEAEVAFRSFPVGSWPAVPPGVLHVVDMGFNTSSLSGAHTHAITFYDGALDDDDLATNVISPLPREVIKAELNAIPTKLVVFLGHDPLGRAASIAAAAISPQTATVEATSHSADPVDTTSHTVRLPSLVQAGDLLIVNFACDDGAAVTWPVGWTSLFTAANGAAQRGASAYRVADGSEVTSAGLPATITVTTSTAQQSAHTSYRISGALTPQASAGNVAGGGNKSDPDALTPVGGAQAYLWIACSAHNDGAEPPIGFPSNYDAPVFDISQGNNGCSMVSAHRIKNVASEDPAAFIFNGSGQSVAWTIAVPPANVYTSSVVSFPSSVMFWQDVATASVLVASAGIPHLIGTSMGIPTLMVTNTAQEHANISAIVPLSLRGWEYLGYLGNLTDNQVGTAARLLLTGARDGFDGNVSKARRLAMGAHGLLRGQEQGVRRISEWIARDVLGAGSRQLPWGPWGLWPNLRLAPNPGKV